MGLLKFTFKRFEIYIEGFMGLYNSPELIVRITATRKVFKKKYSCGFLFGKLGPKLRYTSPTLNIDTLQNHSHITLFIMCVYV